MGNACYYQDSENYRCSICCCYIEKKTTRSGIPNVSRMSRDQAGGIIESDIDNIMKRHNQQIDQVFQRHQKEMDRVFGRTFSEQQEL